MVIYLACYGAIGLLLYKFEKHNHKKAILIICILVLSLLAGFRDQTIGVDVRIYAKGVCSAADRVSSLKEAEEYLFQSALHKINGIETGYLLMALIGEKVFGGLFGVLFITSLITNIGIFAGLYRIREHISFDVAIMIYCFMFYQHTYNMMRQWMAIAVVIFGIKYIYDRRLIKYIAVILIAMLFHRSAFIGMGLYVIALYMDRPRSRMRQLTVLAAVVFGVAFFQTIVQTMVFSGILTAKYLPYAMGNSVSIFLPELIIRTPPILLCGLLYVPLKQNDEHHAFWFLIMLVETAISQLHSVMDFATRIGAYFTVGQIIEMSMACKLGEQKQRFIVKSLVILYAVLYWFVIYIYFGYNETFPYTSRILGLG